MKPRAPKAARAGRSRTKSARPEFDGVALALYQSLFAACAEEMGATLMRTAHSPNIKERLDHSCAIFDGAGRLVAQAAHIPVHLGSMPKAVEAALASGPLGPGDVVLLNDPYAGGTHLPDLTLVSPVYLGSRSLPRGSRARDRSMRRDSRDRSASSGTCPDFIVASRAHHADIGGAAPGSMPIAREVYEEGLRLPPVFLVRNGQLQHDVLKLVLANVRTPDERRADLAAQLGAQATGERRLIELARRAPAGNGARGRDGSVLARAAEALMAHAEARVRAALARLLRGTFAFADALDDDGLGNGPIPIAVTLTLRGDSVRVDFTGSSAQTAGPVNAVEAVTRAATYYVVRCVLGELPVNDGTFRPIEVVAPAGTVVNPRPPAAVGAGNVETSQRIVDVVMGAFARALPDRIPAASYGTMSNLLIGGSDPRTGRAFTYYETLGGGHGAGPGWNGASALQGHMTNTRNTPIEVLEHAYPLRVRATRIRRGSGGDGATRGGEGIERVLELRAAARVTVISDRRVTRPYGLAGGAPGAAGVNTIAAAPAAPAGADARSGAAVTIMPGKFQIDLAERSVLTVASPGGGGFGRATTRRAKRPPRRGG